MARFLHCGAEEHGPQTTMAEKSAVEILSNGKVGAKRMHNPLLRYLEQGGSYRDERSLLQPLAQL